MTPDQIQTLLAYLSSARDTIDKATAEPLITQGLGYIDRATTYIQSQCDHNTIDLGDAEHQDIVCVICGGKDKTVEQKHKKILSDIPY
jgi:hypothetical protein